MPVDPVAGLAWSCLVWCTGEALREIQNVKSAATVGVPVLSGSCRIATLWSPRHVRTRTLRCGKSASATWMQRRDGFPHLERHLIACALEGASLETAVSSSSFSIQSCFGAAAGGVWQRLQNHGLFQIAWFVHTWYLYHPLQNGNN